MREQIPTALLTTSHVRKPKGWWSWVPRRLVVIAQERSVMSDILIALMDGVEACLVQRRTPYETSRYLMSEEEEEALFVRCLR